MELVSEQGKPVSVLLVEDDMETLVLLADIMRKKFPRIVFHAVTSGGAGREVFESHQSALVITDLNLPGLNGLEMAKAIRAVRAETRFIFLTGESERETLEAAGEQGFRVDHYIEKPVPFRSLFAAVEQCLSGIAE
jgi:DNA-binding response OmpR family regulator